MTLPAIEKGAREASRPVPPLIAHAPVCVHENPDEVRAALRQQFGHPGLPFYQNMLIEAGYPEAKEGVWSDAMIDGVAVGAGFDLAAACDIRIATPRARFMVAYVRVGLFPGFGGTWLYPRTLGSMGKAAGTARPSPPALTSDGMAHAPVARAKRM